MAGADPSVKERFSLTARCEKCGGYAFLARCVPDAMKRDGTEIWTYECCDCEHTMRRLSSDLTRDRPPQPPTAWRERA